MRITRGLRPYFALALFLSVAATWSPEAKTSTPPDPSRERPSTVVVSVPEDGFHWTDAGVGAAAMFATTLLALGVLLALRPDRGGTANPLGAPVSAEGEDIYAARQE